MRDRKANKTTVLLLSSSSSEEDEHSTDNYSNDDYNVDEEDENFTNPSQSDEESEWSGGQEEEEEEEEADLASIEEDGSDSGSPVDDQSRYNRVLYLLKGQRDLEVLKLEECKAYLRKHGLRISGTKETLVQRIREHWRIKDGNGEKLYPRASFSINCTGDVCKGDVVVFTQKVYEKFDKMTRSGNPLGKRTVAGRIVKESYGAAKQQHTFNVEVLWSKGLKKLPPLFPLLVKGRNLYRMKTFRQRWGDEAERSKVLAEKHKRGAVARQTRAMKRAHSAIGGAKCTRHSHQERRSPKRRRVEEPGRTARSETNKNGCDRGKAKMARTVKQGGVKASAKHLQLNRRDDHGDLLCYPFINSGPRHTQMHLHPRDTTSGFHVNRGPFHYELGSTSRHYTHTRMAPELQHRQYNHSDHIHHPHNTAGYELDRRHVHYNLNHRQLNPVPLGTQMYRGFGNEFLRCSTPGCGDERAENCVVSACWRCCRRTGRRCLKHQL